MTGESAVELIVLAIKVDDPTLADRLTALLSDVPGLRLARVNEHADVAANKSIALRLGISVHTVKFHVASLLDKFEAIGRTDAVAQAVRLGVIQL